MFEAENFYQTIWHHAPDAENFHSYCYRNVTFPVLSHIFLCDVSASSKQLSSSHNSFVKIVKISP